MKAHLRKLILLALGVMSVAGCISQKRTPYHEIALTGEAARETDFYWPFYMGDGRAHYALWPLFKVSPGCFEAFPLYNYDHGIHDVALIATYSSKTQESRVLPLWYQNKNGWLLAPFVYYFKDDDGLAVGCPMLFNRIQEKDDVTLQSLLYYAELKPKTSLHLLVPFFSYYTEHENENYSLWTLLGRRGVETHTFNDTTTTRRAWTRSTLFLYGMTDVQTWEGTKEKPREKCVMDDSKKWFFPFYWNWEDHLKGERNDLVFPLFFRTVAQQDAPGTWATPLFGWAADASWWYALNCGRYQGANWCLPFAFWSLEEEDGRTKRELWTTLGYLDRSWGEQGDTKVHAWGVGPLFPVLANGDEETFNLLAGLLWRQKDRPLKNAEFKRRWHETQCATCAPRNTSRRYGSASKHLLLGSLYWQETEREYEAESLSEKRPIYWEEESSRYGILLWSQSKTTLQGGEYLPEGAIFPGNSGEEYSLLGGLWATESYRNQTVRRHNKGDECVDKHHLAGDDYTQFNSERKYDAQTYGWICWHQEEVVERDAKHNQHLSTFFRTPLFGLGKTLYRTADGQTFDGGNRFSALLGLYRSETETQYGDFEFYGAFDLDPTLKKHIVHSTERDLLWSLLWKWENDTNITLQPTADAIDIDPKTEACETSVDTEHSLLYGLLWNSEEYAVSYNTHEHYYRAHNERSLLCGFLYDDEFYTTQEHTYCMREDCANKPDDTEDGYECSNVIKRECYTTHEQDILCGLLMNRKLKDKLVYERGEPETCKVDIYEDKFSVLLGIPYLSKRERDGTVDRRGLFGLLFDQNISPSEKTSTFGILGYLYRRNRHADGTREQLIFPFIRTAINDSTHTWHFSFCGRLFKVERLPDGDTEWTLFWL